MKITTFPTVWQLLTDFNATNIGHWIQNLKSRKGGKLQPMDESSTREVQQNTCLIHRINL
jgi:hypothetical protein